jgi:hypothetical protein
MPLLAMARGRDATDVAIVTSFDPCKLAGFKVLTEEVASTSPREELTEFLGTQCRNRFVHRMLIAASRALRLPTSARGPERSTCSVCPHVRCWGRSGNLDPVVG